MKKTNAMRLLATAKIPYRSILYQYDSDNLDVAKIAEENGLVLAQIYKSLVLEGSNKQLLMALVPGDRQLDLKRLKKSLGMKQLNLLPQDKLQAKTGYIRGGCSPLGLKQPIPIYMDQRALDLPQFAINAGKRGILLELSPLALQELLEIEVLPLSKG